MEDLFAQFSTIFFGASSNTIEALGVNFSIAISMGLLGAAFSLFFLQLLQV